MENDFNVILDESIYSKLASRELSNIILINTGKTKKFKVGNIITISNDEGDVFDAEIVDMLYFENIPDALNMVNKKEFGFLSSDTNTTIEDKLLKQYKLIDVDKFGIVVIKIKKL